MNTAPRALVHAVDEIENLLRRGLTPITDNPDALRELGFERAYPQIAHYKGVGSIDEAASFVCQAP